VKITVCVSTYNRPRLLGYLIWCFEHQTNHENREMLILDDAGQLLPTSGDRWQIFSVDERFPSLGAKRNALARLVPTSSDAIAVWDDDDIYMPWALEATCAALEKAPWSRPSLALTPSMGTLRPLRTYTQPDRSDRAYQGGWGYRTEAFWQVGGYPADVSVGEDLELARRFMAAGIEDADPIALGHTPFYVFGPWGNLHLGGLSYEGWPRAAEVGEPIRIEPRQPAVRLERTAITGEPLPRPWRGNWLTNYPIEKE